MIFKGVGVSSGIATTPTANKYGTESAGTKQLETHSPTEESSIGISTWRRSNNCTQITAKSAPSELMANAPKDQSRNRLRKSQSRVISRLRVSYPDSVSTIPRYPAAAGNSTTESRLTNQYGTRRSCNGLVIGGDTRNNRRMTVPESISTPTPSKHCTGSGGR